jgi:hypothetical protein
LRVPLFQIKGLSATHPHGPWISQSGGADRAKREAWRSQRSDRQIPMN